METFKFLSQVKRLQNIAYQLGQEETKEMTRGKYLNILRCIDFLERTSRFFMSLELYQMNPFNHHNQMVSKNIARYCLNH